MDLTEQNTGELSSDPPNFEETVLHVEGNGTTSLGSVNESIGDEVEIESSVRIGVDALGGESVPDLVSESTSLSPIMTENLDAVNAKNEDNAELVPLPANENLGGKLDAELDWNSRLQPDSRDVSEVLSSTLPDSSGILVSSANLMKIDSPWSGDSIPFSNSVLSLLGESVMDPNEPSVDQSPFLAKANHSSLVNTNECNTSPREPNLNNGEIGECSGIAESTAVYSSTSTESSPTTEASSTASHPNEGDPTFQEGMHT